MFEKDGLTIPLLQVWAPSQIHQTGRKYAVLVTTRGEYSAIVVIRGEYAAIVVTRGEYCMKL